MVLWLVYLVETKDVSIIELLVWPIFTFVTAAFGIDQYSKLQQNTIGSPDRRGDKRSSEYPDREDK